MSEIYLCHRCLGPIWFPHGQKMHLGTGWYCWKQQQAEEGHATVADQVLELASALPEEAIRELCVQADRLYRHCADDRGQRQILDFLESQLKQGNSAVVGAFLRELRTERSLQSRQLVDRLVATDGWRTFALRQAAGPQAGGRARGRGRTRSRAAEGLPRDRRAAKEPRPAAAP